MAFTSYAQNYEDVMLWRALKHIPEGFYIDVGANDPLVDSVTKAFYERGWNGINIEPLPSHAADLRAQRERDINLQCAAGAESGELVLWECDVRGWATASQEVVAQHMADGHDGMFHKVPVRRLAEICEEFVSDDIHFLKVDVEGFEESVIRGMDFSRFRPWILVIEATKPNSTIEEHDKWESLVFDARYVLAYCDGLNRFYVAKEHSELLGALRYPPNVFDSFARSEHVCAELRAQQAEVKAQQLESRAATVEAEARVALAEARTSTVEAEARVALAEARISTVEAEARTSTVEAEARVALAEARTATVEAEARVALAEARTATIEAEARVALAETRTAIFEAEARVALAEAATQKALQQASEWHERVVAIHNSSSWKITKPFRALARIVDRQTTVAQVYSDSTAILRRFIRIRTRLISMVKWAGARAQRAPRFKRFAMRLLRGHPGLHQKLRRIYSESQHKEQPQPANWSGTPTAAITPFFVDVSDDRGCVIQLPPCGMNANQRSPLEANFNTYREPR